jgi:peptidyl-prolyl cis-trans isomerase SurA
MRIMPQGVIRSGAALAAVVSLALAVACQKSAPAKPAASANVWAVVNTKEITKDDVDRMFKGSVDPTNAPSDEEALTMKLGIVDELINQEILLARADAAKLTVTDDEVSKTLTERKGGQTDAAFDLQLSQRGLTSDDLKKSIRRELTINKLLDKDVTSKAAPSEDDITAFFSAHRADFNYAEPQYRFAQIVVTPVRDPQLRNRMNDDAGTPEEAKRKVDLLLGKLKAGAEFASLATDYSEDPQSVAQGGDLGFHPASAFRNAPPSIQDAVLKAQPGNINLVTSNGSYSIILLIAKEPAGQRELSTPVVHDSIRDMLRQRKEQLLRTAYIASARNDATVDNRLARLVVEGQGKIK